MAAQSGAKVLKTYYRRRAKRARIDAPPSGDTSLARSSWRDWENLACGPAELIAERVLSVDVADYIRFRAVCSAWWRRTGDPRVALHGALDRRFHPRQWIMLQDTDDDAARPLRRRFLNISTCECIWTELSELHGRTVLAPTPEGLLILFDEGEEEYNLCLLNPLTGVRTDLPSVKTLLSGHQPPSPYRQTLAMYGPGITVADDSTVVLNFSWLRLLAIARPGDENWTKVSHNHERISVRTVLSFQGRVYCATDRELVMVVEISTDQPPRLAKAAKIKGRVFSICTDTVHLVNNGGELTAVHRMFRLCNDAQDKYAMIYRVYRVDLDTRKTTRVHGLGGRAVFIGKHRALSVPAGLFPSIAGDSLYLGYDCEEKHGREVIDSYRLLDGEKERNFAVGKRQVHPRSIVDCLSMCVGA